MSVRCCSSVSIHAARPVRAMSPGVPFASFSIRCHRAVDTTDVPCVATSVRSPLGPVIQRADDARPRTSHARRVVNVATSSTETAVERAAMTSWSRSSHRRAWRSASWSVRRCREWAPCLAMVIRNVRSSIASTRSVSKATANAPSGPLFVVSGTQAKAFTASSLIAEVRDSRSPYASAYVRRLSIHTGSPVRAATARGMAESSATASKRRRRVAS
jgi:hypothetical protein